MILPPHVTECCRPLTMYNVDLLTRNAECHDEAFRKLLELFGEEMSDLERIAVIGDRISEGHLEIMVPVRWLQRIPSPSIN